MTRSGFHRFVRSLRDSAFPALMLAMAMGVTLALFSLYSEIVLRHPKGQDRTVSFGLSFTDAEGRVGTDSPSPAELKDAQAYAGLDGKPVQQEVKYLRVDAGGESRSLMVAYASKDFFSTLGIGAAVGRTFDDQDPDTGAVLSWSAWEHYRGSVQMGSPIVVDGVTLPVIGVLPLGFNGFWPGYEPKVWVTLEARSRSGPEEAKTLADRNAGVYTFARLRQGVSPEQAESALGPMVESWRTQRSPVARSARAVIRPIGELRENAWHFILPEATFLWVASGLLVAMAVLNLVSLQIARWMKDKNAWTTKMALGAPPVRLIAEFSYPMLLALVLGVVGALAITLVQGNLLASFVPPSEYPTHFQIHLDWHIGFAALGIIVVLAIPVMAIAWVWFMRSAGRIGTQENMSGLAWRKSLMGIQVALSVVLLCGTTSSLAELWRARSVRLGFDVSGVHAFSFGFPAHVPGGAKAVREEWTKIFDRFRMMPNSQVACVEIPPCEAYEPKGRTYRNESGAPADCYVSKISAGTFALLHVPFVMGRDFTDSDGPEAPLVAIVSVPAGQVLWPGANPIGRFLDDKDGRRFQVIGVVADHLWEGTDKKRGHLPMVFQSVRQRPSNLQTLLIRSDSSALKLSEWVEREVAAVDPRLTIQRSEPLAGRVERMYQARYLVAVLFGMMGLTALAIAILGLYALQQYLTAMRLKEAGLKMALGATPWMVRLDFLRGVSWPMGIGLGVGIVGAAAGWRVLGAIMIGLAPLSVLAVALTVIGLGTVGTLAALVPLRKLDNSEPVELLKNNAI